MPFCIGSQQHLVAKTTIDSCPSPQISLTSYRNNIIIIKRFQIILQEKFPFSKFGHILYTVEVYT